MDLSEIIYTEEQRGQTRKVPRDTKLIGAFQFKKNRKCIVLTISFVLSIIWQIKFSNDIDRYPATPFAVRVNIFIKMVSLVLYLMILDECFNSETRRDLCEMKLMDFPDASKYMGKLRKAEPIVWWKVTCYDYFNGAKMISKAINVRFNNGLLNYRDMSEIVVFDQKSQLVKISMGKGFTFGSRKRVTQYHYARTAFFLDYEYQDECAEKLEGMDLLSKDTVFHDVVWAGRVPRFVNLFTYWLCSCLLLSWPYRVYVNYMTATVNVDIDKIFSSRPSRRKRLLRNIGSRPSRRTRLLRNIVYRPLPLDLTVFNISDLFLADTENDPETYDSVLREPKFRLPDSQCRCEYNQSGDYFAYHYHTDLGRYDLSPSFTNAIQAAFPFTWQD